MEGSNRRSSEGGRNPNTLKSQCGDSVENSIKTASKAAGIVDTQKQTLHLQEPI